MFLVSCEQEVAAIKKSSKEKQEVLKNCEATIDLSKNKYTEKDKFILWVNKSLTNIDDSISKAIYIVKEEKNTKNGSFICFQNDFGQKKVISEIYLKNIKLASIKHEVYQLNPCVVISKMTKFYYRSKRVKSVYYFFFEESVFKGCLVVNGDRIIKKRKSYLNISSEKIAINWSNRILNNLLLKNF